MRRSLIFLTALCLTILCPAFTIQASEYAVQDTKQDGRTITGNIKDETGEALIGASVSVEGTTIGTMTDMDGNFSLKVPTGKTQIKISYVGYQTQIIKIDGKTVFNIAMNPDGILDEVVVGYGVQKKASLTSAISQIKGEEAFKDRGVSSTAVALQGEIPGLTVTRTSTRPGSEGAAMKIRGDISINGNSSPLILIDGIAGSLDELNAMDGNEIDNISVLKDASAAIYGARSASGVILVTTKRGKKGKAQVSYNASFSRTIDGVQSPLATNRKWLDMFYQAQYNDAAASTNLTDPEAIHKSINWWVFGTFGGTNYLDDSDKTLYKNEELFNALRDGKTLTLKNGSTIERWEPNNYLMDYLYGQANSQKHSVSISGGDDRFNYRASLNYSKANSQLKVAEDGEKKYSGRLNADYKATDQLKIETSMSYEKRDVRTPYAGVGDGWMDPWFWAVYSEDGKPYDTFSKVRNPVSFLSDGGHKKTNWTTFRSNVNVTYDLSKWLKGLSLTGSGAYKTVEKDYQEQSNEVFWYDWIGNQTGNKNDPGFLKEEHMKWTNITLGGFVNYTNRFADVHNIEAMFGMTTEEEDYKKIGAARNKGPIYPGSDLSDLDVWTSGDNNSAYGGQSSWSFVSYVARAKYDYDNRYLVEFTGRRDGSSKLSKKQRWKNFYSISGGWVITNEDFMKNVPYLNFLKLRYNYGRTGSVEGIGNYERFQTIKTGNTYFGSNNQTSLWVDGMRSDQRSWETLDSHNGGVDFTFLNNRLSGSYDYFVKTNNGMFIDITYPSILGSSAPKTNDGKFRTKGWEFQLNWRDKIGDVKYNVGGWIADAWSEVLQYSSVKVPFAGKNGKNDSKFENSNFLIGKPLYPIYVYQTDGIFQTQQEVDAYYEMYYWNADRTGPKAGNIIPAPSESGTSRLRPGARKVVDLDGDGVITERDTYYAGDASPRLTFGFKAGVEWKGIDLQAFFQGVGKQTILRSGNLYAPFVTNYTLQNNTFLNKTWNADNPNTEYAILSRDQNFNKWNYENKDVSVQNNRYIRLKSLVVGYTIPNKWTAKAGISKLRVYFSGDDLWEWTKVKDGYDPEYGESSNNSFPFSRLLTFGFDLTF